MGSISLVRGLAAVITERRRLLRMLQLASRRPLAVFAAVAVFTAIAPLATSLLTGRLVGDVEAGRAGLSFEVVATAIALALSIVALQQISAVRGASSRRLAASIDASVRSEVRMLAARTLPFAVVEGREFQLDAARACDPGQMWRSRTGGAAAVGQLSLVIRFAGTFVMAGVIATVNPGVAVVVTALAIALRALIRREWITHARVTDRSVPLAQDAADLEAAFIEPKHAREFAVFGFGGWLTDRWRAIHDEAAAPPRAVVERIAREQWWLSLLSLLLAAIVIGWLALDAVGARVSAAQLALALVGSVSILSGMANMGPEPFDIDYGLGAVAAFDRMRALVPTTAATPGVAPTRVSEVPPVVEVDRVAFHYGEGEGVFRDVALRIEPGERLALVGRNGAGKSTLTKLLSGLYAPSSGSIRFNGLDTAEPDGAALAGASVAVMHQESLRLPLDLRGNVTMGHAAGDSEIWHALDVAGIGATLRDEGVELSTPMWNAEGERRGLSGGQWQRVCLARAVFSAAHGTRILILDEPTSQLDVEGETRFYDEVMGALDGTTVVLITHRLSTVRRADRIALLDAGGIAELGTHEQLMRADGAYAAMFRLQASRFEEPAS